MKWFLESVSPCSSMQGNLTELCSHCKSSYKSLNVLYGRKELNQTLCIDLEDAVRHLALQMCPHVFIYCWRLCFDWMAGSFSDEHDPQTVEQKLQLFLTARGDGAGHRRVQLHALSAHHLLLEQLPSLGTKKTQAHTPWVTSLVQPLSHTWRFFHRVCGLCQEKGVLTGLMDNRWGLRISVLWLCVGEWMVVKNMKSVSQSFFF